ncbi:MAG: hypothetical protein NC210_06695 [[Clostridium] fimetarium]|nr:hypothetical protein [Alistipes timonensis]MCM1406092.1 hypothetical protein [[Clostridium] fimetarium]
MKTLRKIGLAIMSVAALALTSACDSDDDGKDSPDGGGSDKFEVTLDGKTLKLSHAYWTLDDESTSSSGTHTMSLMFTSYDLVNPPKKLSSINYVSIDYEVPKSQTGLEMANIFNGKYHVYVAQNVTMDDPGWQGENDFNQGKEGWLTVTKEGSSYTITLSPTKISQETEADSKTLKFSYSGPVKPLPAGMLN